ncbi:hypothetical protein VOLCADRAFT_79141 [Volvox carteri f. nagariensis]|uniref:Nuclear cap-binding protein subunit 2 n=1 Tax=Volvox carteri f. nagariensis TaxID=3068 RepID=D8TJC0_VOLCA|nr:uncharacterized protein VOLCADRAFT_79141 [Volvox carteri f. nagariensis]EFJ52515.1 hypothetical protein VOLCADRAFT_79141 [Volvox carteri f. nagariensis]|eukprot:XP_002946588.1 hypothetical protein VOLCADRAFT_79141 [Volvox carteri f. nagariensis]
MQVLNPAITQYRDRRFEGSETDWENALATSTTIYVGNLAFTTREEQLYDVFGRVGHIKRIVMGLDKIQRTPCGFAFAIYYTRKDAEEAVAFLNGTLVDDRAIRVDLDWGFVEGRQYGRGRSGGQVRDEFRQDYDPGRGGYGKLMQAEMMEQMGIGMDAGGGSRQDFKRQRTQGGHPGRAGGGGAGGGGGGRDGAGGGPGGALQAAGGQEGEEVAGGGAGEGREGQQEQEQGGGEAGGDAAGGAVEGHEAKGDGQDGQDIIPEDEDVIPVPADEHIFEGDDGLGA